MNKDKRKGLKADKATRIRTWQARCDDCGVVYNRHTGSGMCLPCIYEDLDIEAEKPRSSRGR